MSWSAPITRVAPSSGQRIWITAAAGVALAGVVARIHNGWGLFPFQDFDGGGHALHVFAWYEGRLPDPRSWSGFHPPLYYLLGAGLWHVLPEAIPVHVGLRWLSAVFGAAAVWLVWRALRCSLPLVDAAVVAVMTWCIPFVVIATSMMGNETLCTLLVTLLLIRMMRLPEEDAHLPRHALGTGVLAGVGLLAKSTGVVALAAVGLTYLVRLRAAPLRALRVAGVTGGVALVIAAPHYLRVMGFAGSSPLSAFSAAAVSPEVKVVMEAQPPGVRTPADYFYLPASTLLHPTYDAPGMLHSVPGLLYASTWADAHGGYLPGGAFPQVLRAQVWLSFVGLLPTVLLFIGAFRVARRPGRYAVWSCPLVMLGALFIAFLAYSWQYPTFAAIKASYMLPALLPLAFLAGEGLVAAPFPVRAVLRVLLLAIALGATGLTWWGWWLPS